MPGRGGLGRAPRAGPREAPAHLRGLGSCPQGRRGGTRVTGVDGVTVIEDLNSTNGITLRGKRVRRHTLRDGDVVGVGQHEILYVDVSAAEHLADTHDDLPAIDANAANEDGGDDAREDAAGAG